MNYCWILSHPIKGETSGSNEKALTAKRQCLKEQIRLGHGWTATFYDTAGKLTHKRQFGAYDWTKV